MCAFACPRAGEAARCESYALPIYPGGAVLRNPNEGVSAYFRLHPDTRVVGDATLDLKYTYSPIVIPDISTMTVSLNGKPVTSRILDAGGAARPRWSVTLPGELFIQGENEIEVSVVHRTVEGMCRDIDNDANWFIIRGDTSLRFVLESAEYELSHFPRPFSDPYTGAKVNTAVYLPEGADDETLTALMNLGSLLGCFSASDSFPENLEVYVGAPGRTDANEILFGKTSVLLPDAAKILGCPISADVPTLSLQTLPNGRARLVIAADDSKAFAKALAALSRPRMARAVTGRLAVLTAPLAEEPSSAPDDLFCGKRRFYTLADYGYATDIPVPGAFHRDAYIDLRRPPNCRVGDGSYFELRFRHSRILDPKKSAVTIFINDIPIRAAALREDNADGGVLRAPIPASELNRSLWRVRMGFYHDLGIVDCSKRYDEVAWSVIERETCVYLGPGNVGYEPVWENFPSDLAVGPGGATDLTVFFTMGKPTPRDLRSAFVLAYYAGVRNRGGFRWRAVSNPNGFNPEEADGTVFALGRNGDASGWSVLAKYLPICPEGGGYNVSRNLGMAADMPSDFDVYEIARVNDSKWLYAFMFKTNERMDDMLADSLRNRFPLSGQISLTDDRGKATSFRGDASHAERKKGLRDAKRLSPLERVGWHFGGMSRAEVVYGLVLCVVALGTLAITFFTRRRK